MPNDPTLPAAAVGLDQTAMRAASAAFWADDLTLPWVGVNIHGRIIDAIRAYLSALPHLASPAGDVALVCADIDAALASLDHHPPFRASIGFWRNSILAIAAERDEARRELDELKTGLAHAEYIIGRDPLEEIVEINKRRLAAERERDALAERLRVVERLIAQRDRLAESSRTFWVRAGKAALAGNASELRNRIALAEAPPAEVVLSDAALTQASADPATEKTHD